MPYKTIKQLPKPIQNSLPKIAQEIFRKVFNAAHVQYESEVRAFRVAWTAVKRKYMKNRKGIWVKK